MQKLTVGQLKAMIANLPDEMEVMHRSHSIVGAGETIIRINSVDHHIFQVTDEIHDPVKPIRKKTAINKKYTHFCVSKATGKIVDGWEYADEYELSDIQYMYAIDMKDNDRKLKDYKLQSAVTLYKQGINPYDSDNWGNN